MIKVSPVKTLEELCLNLKCWHKASAEEAEAEEKAARQENDKSESCWKSMIQVCGWHQYWEKSEK